MNKNSNIYQIIYASVMVLIVGTVLAFIYMALKPKQDDNIANDKRGQILSAVFLKPADKSQIEDTFNKYIVEGFIVDENGNTVSNDKQETFEVNMKNNIMEKSRKLPVFKCKLDDGSIKYIIPVYGAGKTGGLWGPIWGYVAVNDNGKDIYGAYFSHEGETPGLGAEIANPKFQDQFKGKKIYVDGEFKSISVMKAGQKPTDGSEYVDAISGGTMTSRGVEAMLKDCMEPYDAFFKKLQSGTFK
ncbi:MAG: NADH:ubiquinone reductase (Na(+)-transporting) subunit C [Muribaculaceae bacterium]|nr:NADH:ubiquinone reductase (Na(+)-transporting) subunit C [Muribaculaceae bacterium]